MLIVSDQALAHGLLKCMHMRSIVICLAALRAKAWDSKCDSRER